MKRKITQKMVSWYGSSLSDITHFYKVYQLASLIGHEEHLNEQEQDILEIAALVHDIAVPVCREKYGDTSGVHQEAESRLLLKDFLKEFNLPLIQEERVIDLVCHHHTADPILGRDHQILLEADYLVNASESENWKQAMDHCRENVFKTDSGLKLLDSIYGKQHG